MRTAIKSTAGLVILAILTGMNGCMFYPVSKKDVIGPYETILEDETPGLPDGGSEILELKADGTCIQKVSLKDGRTFAAQGTWEWDTDNNRYFNKTITLMGIYWVIDCGTDKNKINPDIEKSIGNVVLSLPVYRNLIGGVALGSDEAPHYEKK